MDSSQVSAETPATMTIVRDNSSRNISNNGTVRRSRSSSRIRSREEFELIPSPKEINTSSQNTHNCIGSCRKISRSMDSDFQEFLEGNIEKLKESSQENTEQIMEQTKQSTREFNILIERLINEQYDHHMQLVTSIAQRSEEQHKLHQEQQHNQAILVRSFERIMSEQKETFNIIIDSLMRLTAELKNNHNAQIQNDNTNRHIIHEMNNEFLMHRKCFEELGPRVAEALISSLNQNGIRLETNCADSPTSALNGNGGNFTSSGISMNHPNTEKPRICITINNVTIDNKIEEIPTNVVTLSDVLPKANCRDSAPGFKWMQLEAHQKIHKPKDHYATIIAFLNSLNEKNELKKFCDEWVNIFRKLMKAHYKVLVNEVFIQQGKFPRHVDNKLNNIAKSIQPESDYIPSTAEQENTARGIQLIRDSIINDWKRSMEKDCAIRDAMKNEFNATLGNLVQSILLPLFQKMTQRQLITLPKKILPALEFILFIRTSKLSEDFETRQARLNERDKQIELTEQVIQERVNTEIESPLYESITSKITELDKKYANAYQLQNKKLNMVWKFLQTNTLMWKPKQPNNNIANRSRSRHNSTSSSRQSSRTRSTSRDSIQSSVKNNRIMSRARTNANNNNNTERPRSVRTPRSSNASTPRVVRIADNSSPRIQNNKAGQTQNTAKKKTRVIKNTQKNNTNKGKPPNNRNNRQK
ncbi:MAG: hypothetical protein ACRC28_03530 [Clostridium sp.]